MKGLKMLTEKEKLNIRSNYSFPNTMFKGLVLQTCKNIVLFGKELTSPIRSLDFSDVFHVKAPDILLHYLDLLLQCCRSRYHCVNHLQKKHSMRLVNWKKKKIKNSVFVFPDTDFCCPAILWFARYI